MLEMVPFTELLSAIVDNRGRTCPTAATGIPLIATNCIKNDALYPVFENIRFVDETTYQTWFRGHPQPGDIIFVCKGSPGRVCWVPDPVGFCIAQDMVAVRPDPKRVYPKYLFAALRSEAVQRSIENMHVGTLIPHFKKGDFDKLLLPFPSPGMQKVIGDTYYDLSYKIELNRRVNRTLEALARAVFRAWFVDFAPVKAKAAGATSFPGMPQPVFDQLPTEFVESDLGPIPAGWSVGALGDHCQINARTARQVDLVGEIEYVDISAVTVGRLDCVTLVDASEAPSRARRRVAHGDTIWSCVRPNHRSYLFIHQPPGNRIVSTGFAVLTPAAFGPAFLYELVTRPEFVEYLVANADGSAYPAVRADHFAARRVIVPPRAPRDAFDEFAMPLRDFVGHHEAESATLAAIRDALLPKLISGDVRIDTAERAVARAV